MLQQCLMQCCSSVYCSAAAVCTAAVCTAVLQQCVQQCVLQCVQRGTVLWLLGPAVGEYLSLSLSLSLWILFRYFSCCLHFFAVLELDRVSPKLNFSWLRKLKVLKIFSELARLDWNWQNRFTTFDLADDDENSQLYRKECLAKMPDGETLQSKLAWDRGGERN